MMGKYKGEGDTSKIMACVERKARAMGCDKSMKDKVQETEVQDNQVTRILHQLLSACEECQYTPMDSDPPLDDKDMKALAGIMHKLVGMVGMDNFQNTLVSDAFAKKSELKVVLDKGLLDEVIRLEEVCGDLRDQVAESDKTQKALKEEYDNIHKDMTVLNDALVAEKTSVKAAQSKLVVLLTSLKDGTDDTVITSVGLTTQKLMDRVV
jgi:hypothetical protein